MSGPVARSTLRRLRAELETAAGDTDELRRLLLELEGLIASGDGGDDGGAEVDRAEALDAWARPDLDREARCGLPEVIYAAGKTPEQVVELARTMAGRTGSALATRVDAALGSELERSVPDSRYHASARIWEAGRRPRLPGASVAVVSAGTSDLPVAEEAAVSLQWLGVGTTVRHDVGIAGLHRIMGCLEELRPADVVIVAAGMDGALPTVVAGLVPAPVVAVPTSVGYGSSFEGLAALLTMLNGCAPGIAVVNIDNGFGAAALAWKILQGSRPGTSAPGGSSGS